MAEYIDKKTIVKEVNNWWRTATIADGKTTLSSYIKALPPADVITIPEGATNGEMIMAMFPDEEIIETDSACVYVGAKMRFDRDFWNTLYRVERKE